MKAYTDLNQSKVLSKILPLGSADMRIGIYVGKYGKVDGTNVHYYSKGESFGAPEIIYAWSLAALLDVLESEIDGEEGETYQLNVEKDGTWWNVWYMERYDEANPIETESTEDLVDACYELIIKLHELHLL